MIIENSVREENVQNNISRELLNFLDHTVLLLSQVNNSEEIDLIMDDFRSKDLFNIFSENREFFGILSAVWLTTFKRVYLENSTQEVPLKLLYVPVLFKEFGWDKQCIESAKDIHRQCLIAMLKNNSLTNILLLLFIEGIVDTHQEAIDNFKLNIGKLVETDDDKKYIEIVLEDIKSLGWKFD